jgi:uncharacterized protein YecT (DUF1311 family)
MMQVFYKTNPRQDTPYRELALRRSREAWIVRVTAGTNRGGADANDSSVDTAKTVDEAREVYDKRFTELTDEGWQAYDPHIPFIE